MANAFIDYKYIGNVENPKDFVLQIISERRIGNIPIDVNVTYSEEEDSIFIETSRGRLVRPLIVVKNGKPLLTEKHISQLEKKELLWSDLIAQGVIEYLDATEEDNALVAFSESELTLEHTHLEINPLDMVGLLTSLVCYGNYNQGVRLTYGSKNQKAAVGIYVVNYPLRADMDVNILHYPQLPIVSTIVMDIINFEKHPIGQNVVVAVMSYKGYNIEDAVILNKGSVERGLGRSTYFRIMGTEELKYSGGLSDEICIPDKDVKGYRSEHDYRLLEEDGVVFVEGEVSEGDVVIGKKSPPRFLSSTEDYTLSTNYKRDSSVALKHGEKGIVDAVFMTQNEEGNKMIQIRIRDHRIPEIGDKFTSRHGQKGVVSILVDENNIPFTASGIKPDMILSPHGLPSRMTVSHLIEILAGKIGALSGRFIDGTLFNSEPEELLRKELIYNGFREDGTELMYNGETGEVYKARIFIGNIYYLRLKHMVANKFQSRARGPIQLLTRQPTEGKSKEGGLRLGEMEKDTFVAHGASLLLKERFDADTTIVPVCERCGLVSIFDSRKNKSFCPLCGENAETSNIEMSYAFKLLLDELKSLIIYPKLILREKY